MSKEISNRKPQASPKTAKKTVKSLAEMATVLLVEDERNLRDFLGKLLKAEGYKVIVAGDGETALSLSEDYLGTIHLLVTDVMMPLMNGKELADRLCSLRPEIKVLFISGYRRADFWPDEVCEDNTDWLPKPFTAPIFNGRVRKILDSVHES